MVASDPVSTVGIIHLGPARLALENAFSWRSVVYFATPSERVLVQTRSGNARARQWLLLRCEVCRLLQKCTLSMNTSEW